MLGQAEVRSTFKASKLGTIAGCMVTHGKIVRNAGVRVLRDDTVVHDGKMGSLKRFAEDAREVLEGFECGILLDGFNDLKEGDVLEVYETSREVAREALTPASASFSRSCTSRKPGTLKEKRAPLASACA